MSMRKKRLGCFLALACGMIPNNGTNCCSASNKALGSNSIATSGRVVSNDDSVTDDTSMLNEKIQQNIASRKDFKQNALGSISTMNEKIVNPSKANAYTNDDLAIDLGTSAFLTVASIVGYKGYNRLMYGVPLYDSKRRKEAYKDISWKDVVELGYKNRGEGVTIGRYFDKETHEKIRTQVVVAGIPTDATQDKNKKEKEKNNNKADNEAKIDIWGGDLEPTTDTLLFRLCGETTYKIQLRAQNTKLKNVCFVCDKETNIIVDSDLVHPAEYMEASCNSITIIDKDNTKKSPKYPNETPEIAINSATLQLNIQRTYNIQINTKYDPYLLNGLRVEDNAPKYKLTGTVPYRGHQCWMILTKEEK